jgi:hypothetical protein
VPLDSPDVLALAVTDTVTDSPVLLLVRQPDAETSSSVLTRVPLSFEPGPLPLAAVAAPQAVGTQGLFGVVVTGRHGEAETLWFDTRSSEFSHRDAWPGSSFVATPFGAGAAFAGGGLFAVATPSGHPLDGWPVRPHPAAEPDSLPAAPSPLRAAPETEAVVGLPSASAVHWLFQGRDGRLFVYDGAGRLAPGWPVAGPSDAAVTPVWGYLGGPSAPVLVAAGTFQRIEGRNAETGALTTSPISRLMAWTGPAVSFPRYDWPMWQQNPWRAPVPPAAQTGTPVSGGLLVAGSHLCYPSPLGAGPLHVRAEFRGGCTARAYLYNLAGEQVARSPALEVSGAGPFEITLAVEKIVSGMYLCRLVAERAGAARESSVVSVAVLR